MIGKSGQAFEVSVDRLFGNFLRNNRARTQNINTQKVNCRSASLTFARTICKRPEDEEQNTLCNLNQWWHQGGYGGNYPSTFVKHGLHISSKNGLKIAMEGWLIFPKENCAPTDLNFYKSEHYSQVP